MERGKICAIYGNGNGKTAVALGKAVKAASVGKRVIMIQFLKGKGELSLEFLKRLEPELKIFRFEKKDMPYDQLSDQEKEEECRNIHNSMNFSRKVLQTGECELLILDEILGLLDNGILSVEEFRQICGMVSPDMEMILTGRKMPEALLACVDEAVEIRNCKTTQQ